MRRRPGLDEGLTLYQLLVSIVVIVILGSLWMAHTRRDGATRVLRALAEVDMPAQARMALLERLKANGVI